MFKQGGRYFLEQYGKTKGKGKVYMGVTEGPTGMIEVPGDIKGKRSKDLQLKGVGRPDLRRGWGREKRQRGKKKTRGT